MDIETGRQINGKDNVGVVLIIRYGDEEVNALTTLAAWEQPCLKFMRVWLGLFRGSMVGQNLTFRHFVEPGLLIQGFTETFAPLAEEKFRKTFVPRIKKALAPILEDFRRQVHEQSSQKRDVYFGAVPNNRRGPVRIGL